MNPLPSNLLEMRKKLEALFDVSDDDLKLFKRKRMQSKHTIFKPGDLITNIYYVVSGDVRITFHETEILLPNEIIIGDYEPLSQLSRRTTLLKVRSVADVIILPFQYFFKIKAEVIEKAKFIKSCFSAVNNRAQFILTKVFKQKTFFREEQVQLEHADGKRDIALIHSGKLRIKKCVDVGVMKKYQTKIEREFSLVEVGQRQLVTENLVCDSPKASLYLCNHYFVKNLCEGFSDFANFLLLNEERNQSHTTRQLKLQQFCRQKLLPVLLPSLYEQSHEHEANSKPSNSKTKSLKIKTEEQNHFCVYRSPNNRLESSPTSSDFELIPFVKRRYPKQPKTIRMKKSLLEMFTIPQFEQIDPEQSIQISCLQNNKFNRKMFFKATNPFSHHRQLSSPIKSEDNRGLQKYFRKNSSFKEPLQQINLIIKQ